MQPPPKFPASLAKLADVYYKDALGTAHRAHSSMRGEGYSVQCAGHQMPKEMGALSRVPDSPARPRTTVLSGAKIGDTTQMIKTCWTTQKL
jgi:phosphoglycerate kinase